jgi:hypothetical protein
VVGHLPSKHKALSSNFNTDKREKRSDAQLINPVIQNPRKQKADYIMSLVWDVLKTKNLLAS